MLIDSSGLSKVKDSVIKTLLLGNEPSAELIAILVVYFVQGILGLARLAVSFFLKDNLLLSPAQVSALLGIVSLPWMLKPILGLISDSLPIFGYRRRPYLILAGLLGTTAWVSLATIVHDSRSAMIAIAVTSLSVAFSDVIVDSIVVERARMESSADSGSLQSLCWGSAAIGGLVTAYFSGLLLEHFTNSAVFLFTAFFPLIISLVAWLITERKTHQNHPNSYVNSLNTFKKQWEQLYKAFAQKSIWLPTGFIFIWQTSPSTDSALFFFTTNELHFEPEFLGRVRLLTSLASLFGIWVFQRFLKSIPFRVICTWSIILCTILRMTVLVLVTHTNRLLGIDDYWFSLGDNLILTVIGQIAFMPIMVLAARICPLGVEATLFAALMSIFNFGGLVSQEMGALIMSWLGITETNFNSLWLLVLISDLCTLIPLLFINWLPAHDPTPEMPELVPVISEANLRETNSEM